MKRNYILFSTVLGAVLILIVMASIWYIDNRCPNFSKKHVLYVSEEMTPEEVRESLDSVTLRPRSFARALKKVTSDRKICPGRYVVGPESTSIYVARMLVYGWQTPQNLTLSGTIRTKGNLARKIASQMMVDSASIAQALDSSDFLEPYGFTPENVFAMFLPDTYQVYWTASVKEIFDRFKREYDAFWTDERLSQAKEQKLTRLQVSILASIVSGETLEPVEYPLIAGVYLNRYRKGMRLQADPTIAFCYNYELNRILKKHLAIDSPYNTYKYAGLPPAPINVPPKACIDAVLNPGNHKYLYFCASPELDGTHRFAVSYKDHLKNARTFQRALAVRERDKKSSL